MNVPTECAVLLLSGGTASVTLLHQLVVGRGEPVQALFVDHGQRSARQELAAAEGQATRLGVELVELDLARVGEAFRNAQARRQAVPLPHRNLVLLALGLSYAANLDAPRLHLAASAEDTRDHASASHAFLAQFRLVCGLLGDVELATPLVGLTRTEIVARGAGLGIDYATTYSCLLGLAQHCGRCPACVRRRAAFHEAGYAEPERFYKA
jgi:7-cyano-7-deazaguanine synthase